MRRRAPPRQGQGLLKTAVKNRQAQHQGLGSMGSIGSDLELRVGQGGSSVEVRVGRPASQAGHDRAASAPQLPVQGAQPSGTGSGEYRPMMFE